jgi:ComF family protein
VDGVYSFYQYDGLLKKIIHTGKYKGAWRIFSSLPCNSNSLQEWSPLFDTPLLCPVPLHPHKRAQRGYNQSQKISELCLSHLGWKSFDGIIKEKESSPQATRVSRKERRDNVRSTFSFTGMAVPETVVLVDDVITTGATVSECALVLKKSGVRTVLAISLARG